VKTNTVKAGLAQLSPGLTELNDLPYTAQEQRYAAASRAVKKSIQDIQPIKIGLRGCPKIGIVARESWYG